MIGAVVVVLLALGGVFYGSSTKDKKPRSITLAMLSAIVGAIAALIALPSLLTIDHGKLPTLGLVATLAIGVAALALAVASKRVPTAPALLLGAALVVWTIFRWLPTGPIAFEHLGAHLQVAGTELWNGLRGFFKDLAGGGVKTPARR